MNSRCAQPRPKGPSLVQLVVADEKHHAEHKSLSFQKAPRGASKPFKEVRRVPLVKCVAKKQRELQPHAYAQLQPEGPSDPQREVHPLSVQRLVV